MVDLDKIFESEGSPIDIDEAEGLIELMEGISQALLNNSQEYRLTRKTAKKILWYLKDEAKRRAESLISGEDPLKGKLERDWTGLPKKWFEEWAKDKWIVLTGCVGDEPDRFGKWVDAEDDDNTQFRATDVEGVPNTYSYQDRWTIVGDVE